MQCGGVHGLKIQDSTHTTLTEEHTTHVTLFPSLKPTSRKEVCIIIQVTEFRIKSLLAEVLSDVQVITID